MLVARFYRCNDRYCGVQVSGHAGYADAGQDIVCASVSSAVQLTANTITECFHIKAEVTAKGDTVTVQIAQQADVEGNASKLLSGLYLHLTILSEEFENTITIEITEV